MPIGGGKIVKQFFKGRWKNKVIVSILLLSLSLVVFAGAASACTDTKNATVNSTTTTTVSNVSGYVNESAAITAHVKNNRKEVNGGQVQFTLNGETYNKTVKFGYAQAQHQEAKSNGRHIPDNG